MHTPNNQCTSDCRRVGCPETSQSHIIAENAKNAARDAHDWVKEERRIELGVEQMAKPPHRSSYVHEPTGRESTMEQLADIQADNVKATQPGRG